MNTDLKSAIEAIDSTLARLCEILTHVESLITDPAPTPAPADPFAGHPELPLDPTCRVIPWEELPSAPKSPAGKMWVYRGDNWPFEVIADGRRVCFLTTWGWTDTHSFSGQFPHIELIDA